MLVHTKQVRQVLFSIRKKALGTRHWEGTGNESTSNRRRQPIMLLLLPAKLRTFRSKIWLDLQLGKSFEDSFPHYGLVIGFFDHVDVWVIKMKSPWSFGHVVCRLHVNRARNTDHAARTCERFVYSIVKITRLYDSQIWQTHFEEIYELRKGLWASFFLIVLLRCWLAEQASSDHVAATPLGHWDTYNSYTAQALCAVTYKRHASKIKETFYFMNILL